MTTPARVEITAVDLFSGTLNKFNQQIGPSIGPLGQMQSAARSLALTLGGIFTVAGAAAFVRQTIDAAAALDDMAEKTGASVEELSRLTQIARIGGHDIGQVETALVRMTKALMQSDDESKGAGAAFKALALSMDELKQKSPAEAVEIFAKALNRFEDGAGKTSVAVAALTKSGAELLPLLKDIATTGGVVAAVTADQAAEAEKLQKQWNALTVAAGNFGQTTVLQMIPAFKELMAFGVQVVGVFTSLGRSIGGAAAQIQAILSGNWSEVTEIRRMMLVDSAKERELQDESIRKIRAAAGGGQDGGAKPKLDIIAAQADKASKAVRSLRSEWDGFDEAVERFVAKNLADELRELADAEKAQVDALRGYFGPLEERLKKLGEENDFYGLLGSQIEDVTVARLEEARATALLNGASDEALANLEREIALRREIADELRVGEGRAVAEQKIEATKDAAKASREEWQRTSDSIAESLTDALLRGFESGADAGKVFADTLKNLFKTLILRPIIQPIAQAASGAVLGALGMGASGSASAADVLGIGSSLSSLTGGAGFGGLVANGLSALGASTGVATGWGAFAGAAAPYLLAAWLAYSALKPKRGGPKATGSGVGSFASDYAALAQQFGGSPLDFGYGLNYESDPRGTATSSTYANLMLGSNVLYRNYGRDAGRGEESLQAAIDEELARMMIAALRETDLSDEVDAIFDAIDPATASAQNLDAALQKAAQTMQEVEQRTADWTASAKGYDDTLRAIGATMESTHNAFADAIADIRFGQLDNAGQYAFLDARIAQQMDVLRSVTDPELVRDYSGRVRSDIVSAYGLLSPEQQKAVADEFIKRLEAADTLTQERLRASVDVTREAFAELPAQFKAAIDAAMDQVVARIAAAVPRQVQVDVRVDQPAAVEVGIG
jgi:hypothetical protein